MNSLPSMVRRALHECAAERGASVLVAISGGPDSTALLCALTSLPEELRLTLHACIVDHGIRPVEEIAGDTAFAESLCMALGVPLTRAAVEAGRIRSRCLRESRSLEDVAREERHRLLRDVARRVGASWIALGHTQDDQVETILMRVIQGSDVGALGIPAARDGLIRPLLGCSRAEVIGFLRSRGQQWREDPTNADVSMLRNRVRHSLLPLLTREFPGARAGILSFSRKAALTAEALDQAFGLTSWKETPQGFSIGVEEFLGYPPAVRARQLMRLYDWLRGPLSPRRLPWRFLEPALGPELRREGGTGVPVPLEGGTGVPVPLEGGDSLAVTVLSGHGVQLVLRTDRLCWERRIVTPGEKSYFIEVSETGTFTVPGIDVEVRLARCPGKRNPAAGQMEVLAQDISWPLVLRSRRAGDEILLERGGMPLKELYAGWKVLEGQRHQIPVLADRKGVVLVLGSAFGYPNRARMNAAVPPGGGADCILVQAGRKQEGT